MDNRKAIAFPKEFTDKCQEQADLTCRSLTMYIQYAVKEFWKMEEQKKNEAKEKIEPPTYQV